MASLDDLQILNNVQHQVANAELVQVMDQLTQEMYVFTSLSSVPIDNRKTQPSPVARLSVFQLI